MPVKECFKHLYILIISILQGEMEKNGFTDINKSDGEFEYSEGISNRNGSFNVYFDKKKQNSKKVLIFLAVFFGICIIGVIIEIIVSGKV